MKAFKLSFTRTSGTNAVLLGFALVVMACSKKEEKAKPAAALPIKTESMTPLAARPEPVEKKVLPVVTPGHLPPNPRVPQSMQSVAGTSGGQRPVTQPQPRQVTMDAERLPTPPAAAAVVRTPEQGNQARLNALQEMFRQRGQKEVPPQSGSAPASTSEEKSASSKTQP